MYTLQQQSEKAVVSAVLDCTTTGDKARFTCGPQPIVVRRISLALSAQPGDAGVVKFDKRVTFGSDSGRGDGDVGVLNLLASAVHAAGKVVYKDVNVKINPGEEIMVEVTDASAALTGAVAHIFYEPSPEQAANIPAMVASS
jgi:hypothetical protein